MITASPFKPPTPYLRASHEWKVIPISAFRIQVLRKEFRDGAWAHVPDALVWTEIASGTEVGVWLSEQFFLG